MHDAWSDDFRTCQFCKRMETGLFRYSVRHYAHAACLLDRFGGAQTFAKLPLAELERFPYFVAKEYDVLDILEYAVKSKGGKTNESYVALRTLREGQDGAQ